MPGSIRSIKRKPSAKSAAKRISRIFKRSNTDDPEVTTPVESGFPKDSLDESRASTSSRYSILSRMTTREEANMPTTPAKDQSGPSGSGVDTEPQKEMEVLSPPPLFSPSSEPSIEQLKFLEFAQPLESVKTPESEVAPSPVQDKPEEPKTAETMLGKQPEPIQMQEGTEKMIDEKPVPLSTPKPVDQPLAPPLTVEDVADKAKLPLLPRNQVGEKLQQESDLGLEAEPKVKTKPTPQLEQKIQDKAELEPKPMLKPEEKIETESEPKAEDISDTGKNIQLKNEPVISPASVQDTPKFLTLPVEKSMVEHKPKTDVAPVKEPVMTPSTVQEELEATEPVNGTNEKLKVTAEADHKIESKAKPKADPKASTKATKPKAQSKVRSETESQKQPMVESKTSFKEVQPKVERKKSMPVQSDPVVPEVNRKPTQMKPSPKASATPATPVTSTVPRTATAPKTPRYAAASSPSSALSITFQASRTVFFPRTAWAPSTARAPITVVAPEIVTLASAWAVPEPAPVPSSASAPRQAHSPSTSWVISSA
ncbi:hypothetical protein F66182_4973 [Fusarium sp. NRRL 66182]|nr:hypothetical protein F66182_4973 [Fusarium sp. NRRL 66182]